MNEEAIFLEALQKASIADRDRFIEEACAGNASLRDAVDLLLRAHDKAGEFLQGRPPEFSATVTPSPITEKSGDSIGPYKLLQQIGEGGMGVVYMAEQTEPVERRVALKIIKPGMDTRQVIARFEAERQALAMMDHPNIAKVLDAGTTEPPLSPGGRGVGGEGGGRPYFVMELVKGLPITQYCDEQQLTPRERLELFLPICQAVQHAHQKGVIHRDLKPSNILIAQYDDRAVPKIIDFGVAKAVSQKLTEKTMFTQYGQIVGTVEYMSPEQARFNQLDVDTRSDIYSLGVLLYELLTGETPFDKQRLRSAAFDELLRIIREEEPPRPSVKLSTCETLPSIAANRHIEPHKLSTLVRGELDWIVMKALEKDRGRRYETASAFAADVQHYLNDEAVVACPPSAAYRFRKFARRNRAPIATTTAIAASLIVVAIGASIAAVRFENLAHRNAELADDLTDALDDAERNLELANTERQHTADALALVTAERQRAEGNLDLALQALDAVYLDAIGTDKLLTEPMRRAEPQNLGPALAAFDPQYVDTIGGDSSSVRQTELHSLNNIPPAKPRLSDLEKELLRRGLSFYDQFAQQNAAGPKAALETARAYYRVGLLQAALGDHSTAESAHRAAVERFERLSRDDPGKAGYFRNLGEAWRGLGSSLMDWPSAKEAFENSRRAFSTAIELNPDNPAIYGQRAVVAEYLGDHRQRLEDRETALRLDPDNLDILRECSNLLQHCPLPDLQNHERSLQLAERLVTLAPDDPRSHVRLGNILESLGDPERALEHYNRAVELAPADGNFIASRANFRRRIGEYDRALDDLNHALQLDPDNTWILGSRSHLHEETGDLDAALRDRTAAIQLTPHDASMHFHAGQIHIRQENWQAAIEELDLATAINPELWVFYKRRGVTLFHLGRFEEALADLKHALELNPDDPSTIVWIPPIEVAECPDESFKRGLAVLADSAVQNSSKGGQAHLNRSYLLFALGEREQSDHDLETAVELAIESARFHWRIAEAFRERGEEDRALEHYSAAVDLEPEDAHFWNHRGMSHHRWERFEQARDDYTRAIELDAAVPGFWSNRAIANVKLKEFEQAEGDASQAIELNSDHVPAHRSRAQARRALGQLEGAVADYTRLIELQSNAPEQQTVADWGHLSQALFRLGRYEEARAGLEKTIALRGDDGPSLDRGPRWWLYAMTLWRLGETERAHKLVEELEQLLTELPPARRLAQERVRAEAIELIGEGSPPIASERAVSRDP